MTTLSLYTFLEKYPDEEAARQYFEERRWKGNKACPYCRSTNIRECKDHNPMPYRCKECDMYFSVRTRTSMERSHIPLHKWLTAIYFLGTSRKGISSIELGKQLGITQKSAWFLAHRIRKGWIPKDNPNDNDNDMLKLGGDAEVEVDETFIGGKRKNMHYKRKKTLPKGRGATGKETVAGAKERNGRVVVKHLPNTTAKSLHSFIRENIALKSTVYTDDFKGYNGLQGYNHDTVSHSTFEYVRGNVHTNGIESFWALLKRMYNGTYHYMSPKHLTKYINECAFRHNVKPLGIMGFIDETFEHMLDTRLTYRELIQYG